MTGATGLWRQLAWVLGPAAALLALITTTALLQGVPLAIVVEDPATLAGLHPLTGVQSSLGILLWCVAAATPMFAACVLRGTLPARRHLFLVCSALLSAYLMLDDLLQFHEKLAIAYLGIRQKYILAALALAVAAYLLAFRREIVAAPYALLASALVLLSLSVVIDTVIIKLVPGHTTLALFAEEGSKWLGIASWCGYFVHYAGRTVADALRQAATGLRAGG